MVICSAIRESLRYSIFLFFFFFFFFFFGEDEISLQQSLHRCRSRFIEFPKIFCFLELPRLRSRNTMRVCRRPDLWIKHELVCTPRNMPTFLDPLFTETGLLLPPPDGFTVHNGKISPSYRKIGRPRRGCDELDGSGVYHRTVHVLPRLTSGSLSCL